MSLPNWPNVEGCVTSYEMQLKENLIPLPIANYLPKNKEGFMLELI